MMDVLDTVEINEPNTSDDSQQADQSTPSASDAVEPELVPTCRLRHGLNEDCLCEIFKYLDVYSLIQLCRLDVYYENLITQSIIGKKLIDFSIPELCCSMDYIFEIFGKSMRKIKIEGPNTVDLDQFLNLVIRHCSEGGLNKLTHLTLRCLRVSSDWLSTSDWLESLTHLTFDGVSVRGDWLISDNGMQNLTYFTLKDVLITSGKLPNGMENLKELRLDPTYDLDMFELSKFLRTKPKLELFVYMAKEDIHSVIEILPTYCPKLRVFSDFHLDNPYRISGISDHLRSRYSAIRYFDSVQELGFTTYTRCGSDLYYPLIQVAKKNKLQSLKIFMNRVDGIVLLEKQERTQYYHQSFTDFTSLKEVELLITSIRSPQIEFNFPFIEFIVKQTNVKKFCVKCEPSICDVYKVIDAAPHLSQLDVSQVTMIRLPVEMRRIVVSIRKRRANLISMGEIEPAPFHLIVNDQQWRELMVYEDVDVILTTSVIKWDNSMLKKQHSINQSSS